MSIHSSRSPGALPLDANSWRRGHSWSLGQTCRPAGIGGIMGNMPLLHAPLSVRNAQIVDAAGTPIRLAGVNWGGAHQDGLVPAGLDKLHRDEIARRIAGWGLNHVRLTFALGTFVNNNGSLKTGPADPARLAANPDLAGLTPWAVYQAVTESLTAAGLAVIPNCHLLYPVPCQNSSIVADLAFRAR